MTMRRGASHLSTEQIEEARELSAIGWSYARIGERLGCAYGTVRLALDADYAVMRRIGSRETRQRRYKPEKRPAGRENASGASVKEDAAARLAEIPKDDRTLTGQMFGDPLRGRSALDKRQHS